MEQRPAQDCLLWRWVNCWDVVESCWSSAGFSTRLVCTFLMRWGRDSPLIWLCRGRRQADVLEPDPSMDLDGWDTAMKTVIQANTYWDQAYTLADVAIQVVCGLTQADMIDAKSRGEVWCMVGRAVQNPDGSLKLTAGPERLPADHPLARAHWSDKVLWMQTRTQGGRCTTASVRRLPAHPEICI